MATTDGWAVVYEDGSRVDIISNFTSFKAPGGGGRRGEISGFSQASRLRLLKLISSLNRDALEKSFFITLTYHKTHIKHEKLKRDLKHFIQKIRRNYPEHSGIWKLEFQKRGSPHYHLLHFGGTTRYISYEWIAKGWNGIADPGNTDHLAAGTQIKGVDNAQHATWYFVEYFGKGYAGSNEFYEQFPGRVWGVYNRKQLPVSKVSFIPLSEGRDRELIHRTLQDQPGGGTNCSRCTIFTSGKASSELADLGLT